MACNVFICTVCAINIHNGDEHNVQDMEFGLKTHVDKLKTLSDKIQVKLEDVKYYHDQLCEVQVLLKGLHDTLEEKIDERVTSHIDKTSTCQNKLKEALATPAFGSEYRNITWAIEAMLESANQALGQQSEAVTVQMKEARVKLTDDLKIKHRHTNAEINVRIDSVAFHIGSIESLASFLQELMTSLNPLEIITIYDDLVTRVNSVLDTEPEGLAPQTFIVFSFDPDAGELDLGMLLEEEVTVAEFIERMAAQEEEVEEEEIIVDEEEVQQLELQQQSVADIEARVMRESQEAINALDAMLEEEGAVGGSDLDSPTTTSSALGSPTNPEATGQLGRGGGPDTSPTSTVSSTASTKSAPGVTMRNNNSTGRGEELARRYSLPALVNSSGGKTRPVIRNSATFNNFTGLTASSQPLTPPQELEAPPSYDGSSSSVSSTSVPTLPVATATSPVSTSAAEAKATTPVSNSGPFARSISAPETNGTNAASPRDTPKEYFFEAQPLHLLWEKLGSNKVISKSEGHDPYRIIRP